MKNNSINKVLLSVIIFVLIFSSFCSIDNSENLYENHETEKVKINVYDGIGGYNSEYYISIDDTLKIIGMITDEMSENSFSVKINERFNILNNIGIVNSETIDHLSDYFEYQENQRYNNLIYRPTPIFDVFNFFNGVFFGIKGEKTYTFGEMNMYRFPFFDSNATAQFSFLSRFSGNGCIFTIGVLGFKYLYDFNTTKYAFPHFPNVSGSAIGFTGVLLEIDVEESIGEEFEGHYILGFGMTVISNWNRQ